MSRKRFLFAIIAAAVLGITGPAQGASPRQSSVPPSSLPQVVRITPLRPIAELKAEALKAEPPEEKGPFEHPQLADLADPNSSIFFDIRYAGSNNFLGEAVYEQGRAFLQMPAALALIRVSVALRLEGYGLLIYDAYRPWYVTKIFWEATPVDKREFVADPSQGSRHNRGCAVDLTLFDLKTGAAVAMPSDYDEMTPRSYADYNGGTRNERKHREILRKAMEKEGFVPMPNEWWHFDYKDWQKYQILNIPLSKLRKPIGAQDASSHGEVVLRIGRGVMPPKFISRVGPSFSSAAREKHIQGVVILSLVVGEDGVPRDIRVKKWLGYGLDEEAVIAVRQWRFAPATKDGRPVAVQVNVEVSFHPGQ